MCELIIMEKIGNIYYSLIGVEKNAFCSLFTIEREYERSS